MIMSTVHLPHPPPLLHVQLHVRLTHLLHLHLMGSTHALQGSVRQYVHGHIDVGEGDTTCTRVGGHGEGANIGTSCNNSQATRETLAPNLRLSPLTTTSTHIHTYTHKRYG